MQKLIEHIVHTSSQRDHTNLCIAIRDAVEALFNPRALSIYRVFENGAKTVLYSCAGIDAQGRFSRNAYLPDVKYSFQIDADPLLQQGQKQHLSTIEFSTADGFRTAFLIRPVDQLLYIVDMNFKSRPTPEQYKVLSGLTEYLSNHVGLLDYGETDSLTRLPNRKTFDKHLYEVLTQAAIDERVTSSTTDGNYRRQPKPDAHHWLAVLDIDHFKSVNDTYGHLIGDEVLIMFARLIRESFRFQDQIFRFGGEEFVVVTQPTDAESIKKVFDRFRQNVETHSFSQVGRVTVSIGYSQLTTSDTPPDVIDRSDEALYYVKQNGRNGLASYEELVASNKLTAKHFQSSDIELF
ncbi:MAG: GGDEF domain-containing protein [Sideroxydans sp.]|nr:GGDEF domain-containing protein [Sideroxydans sp.]